MILKLKKNIAQSLDNPTLIDDVDINKIIVSYKVSLGKKSFKYFIGYIDNENFKPSCTMLPKKVNIEKKLMKLNIFLF